jgi:hypothetical protein
MACSGNGFGVGLGLILGAIAGVITIVTWDKDIYEPPTDPKQKKTKEDKNLDNIINETIKSNNIDKSEKGILLNNFLEKIRNTKNNEVRVAVSNVITVIENLKTYYSRKKADAVPSIPQIEVDVLIAQLLGYANSAIDEYLLLPNITNKANLALFEQLNTIYKSLETVYQKLCKSDEDNYLSKIENDKKTVERLSTDRVSKIKEEKNNDANI